MNDATTASHRSRPADPPTGLAEHSGLVLAYGLVTLGLGTALVVWPDATVTVFTVLVAVQLIVAGVFGITSALSTSRSDGGVRALLGLSAGVALIVGLLILRDPLHSVVVLGMVLGAFWVLVGVIEIVAAFIAPPPSGRDWALFTGVVTLLFGGFLLVYTDLSLKLLVLFVGIWLIVVGVLAVVTALRLRSARTAS